ncbi:MAG: hypothetical protein WDW38_009708 [Sanguina aurantia]
MNPAGATIAGPGIATSNLRPPVSPLISNSRSTCTRPTLAPPCSASKPQRQPLPAKPRKSVPDKPEPGSSTSANTVWAGTARRKDCCYGCGARLQIDTPVGAGYVPPEKYAVKQKHKQLGQVLCERCSGLSNGAMIPGVEDFTQRVQSLLRAARTPGSDDSPPPPATATVSSLNSQLDGTSVGGDGLGGAEPLADAGGAEGQSMELLGRALVSAEQLRNQLMEVKDKKALVIMLVDLLDAAGSLMAKVRDIVGSNPIILVGTKMDLLPTGCLPKDVAEWLSDSAARKKMNLVSVHLVSSHSGEDTPGVHLHHRLPHMLTPEELRLLHPRKRLAAFVPPTPREVMLAQQQLQQQQALTASDAAAEQQAEDDNAAALAALDDALEGEEDEEDEELDDEEEEEAEVTQSRRRFRASGSSGGGGARSQGFRGGATSIPGFGAPLSLDDFGPIGSSDSTEDEQSEASATAAAVAVAAPAPAAPLKGRGGLTFSTVVDPWAEHEAMTRSGVTTRNDSPNTYTPTPASESSSVFTTAAEEEEEEDNSAEFEEPHVGLNRGAGGGGVSSLPVSASYVWSDLVRIDVVSGPPSTSLVFYGPATMRVTTAPFGQPASSSSRPSSSAPAVAPPATSSAPVRLLSCAVSVAARGGLQPHEVRVKVDGGRGALGDVAVSGLPGWVSLSAPAAKRDILLRVWVPRGVEVFLRPSLPCAAPQRTRGAGGAGGEGGEGGSQLDALAQGGNLDPLRDASWWQAMVDMEDGQAGDDEDDDDDSSSKGSRSATVAGRRAAPSSRLDARSAAAAGSRGGAGAAEDGAEAEEVVVSATVQDILRRPRLDESSLEALEYEGDTGNYPAERSGGPRSFGQDRPSGPGGSNSRSSSRSSNRSSGSSTSRSGASGARQASDAVSFVGGGGRGSSGGARRESAGADRNVSAPPPAREKEEGKTREAAGTGPAPRGQYLSPALRRRAAAKP